MFRIFFSLGASPWRWLLWGLAALWLSPVCAAELAVTSARTAEGMTVQWWARGADAAPTTAAALEARGVALATKPPLLAPDPALGACYLLMTDTSLSMRRQLKSQVRPLLSALVAAQPAWHRYAVARFDTDLEMLAPFGADGAALQRAVEALTPRGKRTELFRAALSGLRELARCEGYRRVLVMFSDGDAEDDPDAYRLEDVVKAARQQQVSIVTVGFNDTIKLQILSRLSEDTGGRGWRFEPELAKRLPAQLASVTDTGGRLTVPLSAVPFDTDRLTLRATLANGAELQAVVPIEPIPAPPQAPPPLPWWQRRAAGLPLWVWLLAAAALGLIVLLVWSGRRGDAEAPTSGEAILLDHPVASIHFDGGEYFMDRHTITIGALPENDLVIDDDTVSRQHATIDYRDGEFHLTDRGSSNGSRVNGVEVQHQQLHDGDVLQFGDWHGEFEILVDEGGELEQTAS